MKKYIRIILMMAIVLGLASCVQPVSEVVKLEVINWPEADASLENVFRAYFTDQAYDLSDVLIKVTYNDSTTQTLHIDEVTIRGDFTIDEGIIYLMQETGTYEVKVSYGGVELKLSYEVRLRPTIIAGGSTYQTIQSAINASVTGDVIYILEGLYEEELLIQNKTNLTIIGAGQGLTVIAPSRAYAVDNNGISLETSENVTISDLTIDGFANDALGAISTFRDGVYYHGNGGGNNHTFTRLEIKNIDRRAISVWPMTTQNTTIKDNQISNVHGLSMGTWSGGIGIVLSGTGSIDGNTINGVYYGIISNSEVAGGTVDIKNNVIEDIGVADYFTYGINVWAKSAETYTINNNVITSDTDHFQGLYINYVGTGSEITDNVITLNGEHGVAMELINNRNGGYLVEGNAITTNRSNVGMLLAQVGSSSIPMVVTNNDMINVSNDVSFDNVYHWIPFGTADQYREVGLIISSSHLVQRVRDTVSGFYGNITNNRIQGFKEALALIVDTDPYCQNNSICSLNMIFEDNVVLDFETAASYAQIKALTIFVDSYGRTVYEDMVHEVISLDEETYPLQYVSLNYWGISSITSMLFNSERIIFSPWYTTEDMDETSE